jgi:alkyldihydroxyacetonephosphate synthase
MKWCGWGNPSYEFTLDDKPSLWPFISEKLKTTQDPNTISNPALSLEEIKLAEPHENIAFLSSIKNRFETRNDKDARVIHAYGRSFRDIWRLRNGELGKVPDLIIYPKSEEEISQIVQIANETNVVVIPFGGGSNIAGSLEARDEEGRMVVTLDMQKMNRLVHIDLQSKLATFEAGIFGPDLEEKLNQMEMTLGHFPDSFEFSTLGGWVATRSAGMQSDKYGKIEDMVISLRMVTPQGKIITRTVPKCSNGIDIKHLCIGSEGILGIITQVSLQIHPLPEVKEYGSFLFPNFELGVSAIYECARKEICPSMTRLNDSIKTALSFAFKKKQTSFLAKAMKFYLKSIKQMDFEKVSLLLVCFEGSRQSVKMQKRCALEIYRKYGAVYLGKKPGLEFAKTKYDFPYVRDFALDRGIIADVSETATHWSNLLPLYHAAKRGIEEKMPPQSLCGCHISHTYQTGASLYFTYAWVQPKENVLEQYQQIKNGAEDAFMKGGASLSHHHGVGYEHMPWIEEEISATGLKALMGLKKELDPNGIMNPGKIIPSRVHELV